MNIRLLKSKMALGGDTQITLATSLGISLPSVCCKLSGKTPFKQNEIAQIAKRYDLSADEIKEIFFSEV